MEKNNVLLAILATAISLASSTVYSSQNSCDLALGIDHVYMTNKEQLKIADKIKEKGYSLVDQNASVKVTLFVTDNVEKIPQLCRLLNGPGVCNTFYGKAALRIESLSLAGIPNIVSRDERVLHNITTDSLATSYDDWGPSEFLGVRANEFVTDYLSLVQKMPSCDQLGQMHRQCEIINGENVCDDPK